MPLKPGYTYIMGSPTGTLYIGVTSDIYTRVMQHKNGTVEGFSKKYNCTRLLYYEGHETILLQEPSYVERNLQNPQLLIASLLNHHKFPLYSTAH